MEHAQRDVVNAKLIGLDFVLILILMEHAQRGDVKIHTDETGRVLILILMEHAQRALAAVINKKTKRGLNPYFNGTCSKRFCCSLYEGLILKVLILILMEHAQRVKNDRVVSVWTKES